MGFFSDLKEDLSQAVNELMPEEEKVKADEPMALEDSGVSLDEMLKNIDDFQLPEDMEAEAAQSEPAAAEPVGQEEAAVEAAEESGVQSEPELYGGFEAAEESGVQSEPELYGGFEAAEESVVQSEPELHSDSEVEPEVYSEPAYDGQTASEESEADAEMEELLAQMLAETPESEPVQEAEDDIMQDDIMQDEAIQNETIMEESKGEEEEMDMEDMELVRDREVSDETSVITEGMTITGDVSTLGSIDVIGTVNGNIDAMGKLNITGHVNGNSKAAEIYAESAKINGEIVSEGAVKIGASSVIIGNISATSAAIAGAVKGDIDVKGPVILDASAIVMGNIKSKSVQINNGAVIEGMCSQCYADVSPTTFFDEYKPEGIRKSKAKQNEQREK